MSYILVDDSNVQHIWTDDEGQEHAVPPTFYADSGNPCDGDTGNDMDYTRRS